MRRAALLKEKSKAMMFTCWHCLNILTTICVFGRVMHTRTMEIVSLRCPHCGAEYRNTITETKAPDKKGADLEHIKNVPR
jgi:RNase P subunit RPR2